MTASGKLTDAIYSLYNVGTFTLGDFKDEFVYRNMHVLHIQDNRRFDMILSSSMFEMCRIFLGMDTYKYTIFASHREINILYDARIHGVSCCIIG